MKVTALEKLIACPKILRGTDFGAYDENVEMNTRTKTCSLKVVNGGRRLYGTAAILHMTSRAGGWDKWLREFTEDVARKAADDAIGKLLSEQSKPKLSVVK